MFINTIRRFILRCKIDQRSATQIGDVVNKYHRQNCPGTHDFDEVMRTADFKGFFLVHHQLKFSSVLALNFQYTALSTPLCQGSWVRYPVWQHTFVSPSPFSRRAVVSYWRKYVHEVLVNRLGGLSLPRKSVVRLTDRPNMTLDVYRGGKTMQQQRVIW